jgi:hypothetical protein
MGDQTRKKQRLKKFSNFETVARKAKRYGIDNLFVSSRPEKKYMVQDSAGKWVHFGAMGMEDFTKHKDLKRRKNYLRRAGSIRGKWKQNKYSANNLAMHLLW